jgi:hypothetical protein
MGKKAKEHRKKVAARNQKIKSQQSAMQKLFNDSMKTQLEELQKQYETEKKGIVDTNQQ